MKIMRHATEQPFILATGLAALIHSTWSLGTLFAGEAPTDVWSVAFAYWIVPAFLIAFAMDVGQISTSAQIREHGMTFSRGITFVVFALATYYLQWLYIAHHMPALALAEGVSEFHRPLTLFLRDMGMWIIPALLPLSTLLYTFSGDHKAGQLSATVTSDHDTVADVPTVNKLTEDAPHDDWETMLFDKPTEFTVECECGWQKTYDNEASAGRGLSMHKYNCQQSTVAEMNGTH